MANPIPPTPEPPEFRLAQRKRAWGLIPTVFALAIAACALWLAWKFLEWSGVAMALAVLALLYAFVWRKGAPKNTGE